MIRVGVLWIAGGSGKSVLTEDLRASFAAEVVPSSVTFTKPASVGKSELASSMLDDLGLPRPESARNAGSRFRRPR